MIGRILIPLLLLSALAPQLQAQGQVSVTVDWEPRDCGEVVLDPPGGNYSPGSQVVLTAKPAEACRFSRWVTGLPGLNNTVTNPLYVTLFSDAYFKALFVRLKPAEARAAPGDTPPRDVAFIKVSANISNFREEVKMARIGEAVWISAPREVPLNESARYVFVGWGGDLPAQTTEPTARVTVTGNIHAVALYKLYMRFLDIWYPAEEFTHYYAPTIEVERGVRMSPRGLRLYFANMTLPLGTPIPRELIPMVEPIYVREYRLSVRCPGCGDLYLLLNNRPVIASGHVAEWFEENSTVVLRVLDEETPAAWVLTRNHVVFMDGPTDLSVACEPKPHAWAYGSPIHPLLELLVEQARGTGLYPFVSGVAASPTAAYALIASIVGSAAAAAFGLATLARKVSGVRLGAEPSLEKIVREGLKQPEKILGMIPKIEGAGEAGLRAEEAPEEAPFPEIRLPVREAGPNPAAEVGEAAGEPRALEPERPRIGAREFLRMLESGRVDAEALVEAVAENPWLFKKVADRRGLEVEGEYRPSEARELLGKLGRRAVALYGGDKHTREYIAGSVGPEYVRLENFVARTVDEALKAVRRLRAGLIIDETVDETTTRNTLYAARLLGLPAIKLSTDPLRGLDCVEVRSPDVFRLFGYIAYRMVAAGRYMGLEEAVELAKVARAARGYATVDRFFDEAWKTDLRSFEQSEMSLAFSQEELEALTIWRGEGSLKKALEHYGAVVSQLDPVRHLHKLKMFREKVEKLSKLGRELSQLRERLREGGVEEAVEEAGEGRGVGEPATPPQIDVDKMFSEVEDVSEWLGEDVEAEEDER